MKKWHPVQLVFNGPLVSENDVVNPFLDYRLNVQFTSPTGQVYIVPGFYAADGNAAETSAISGRKWAARFSPDEIGEWTYATSFRTGNQVAINLDPTAGTPTSFDGANGSFIITSNDKILPDNRANGRLDYVGGHFYQYQETQTYFLKVGTDSPENLLAYGDFDNTVAKKDWLPHSSDWVNGNPTWQGNKGTGLIGAINYLSTQGMNAFSFITMSVNGDGQDVWPWAAVNHSDLNGNSANEIANRLRYDVSKLEQWEIILSHGDSKGMFLHFKTQETENDLLLDGGELDVERKLYYRELVSRFGHHLALNWNLGEENDLYSNLGDSSNSRIVAYADYIRAIDPYDHPITVHSFPDEQDQLYQPLLGTGNALTGPSIQSLIGDIHADVKRWVEASKVAGKPWAVANDEQGDPQAGVAADATFSGNKGIIPDNRDEVRHKSLWGTLLAGGYGVEYYYGYSTGETDLSAQDFRSRESKWQDAKIALDFFHQELPFWEMENADNLTSSELAYCLGKEDEIYVVFKPQGLTTTIDLSSLNGTFSIAWFDPENGGALQNGSLSYIVGGLEREIGEAPNNPDKDWVVLIKKIAGSPIAEINADTIEGEIPLTVTFSGDQSTDDSGIVSYAWDFGDGNISNDANPIHTYGSIGTFLATLTVTDADGLQDTDVIQITVNTSTAWVDKDENENYTARHESSFVQAGDKFYLMGGRENARSIDVYSYQSDTWSTLTDSAPFEFNHFQAVEYQGLIWVIGAFQDNNFPNETPAEHIWIFDPSTTEWIQGPEIPIERRRGGAGLVLYNDMFYLLGGNTIGHNGGYVAQFDVYDPKTGSWTILADAPRARDHFAAVVINNKLYAAGGRLSGGNGGVWKPTIMEVDVYDFTTSVWTTLPLDQNLPTPRAGAATVNFNNKLLVIGGEVENEVVYGENMDDALKITEQYDPTTQSWERLGDLNYERHGFQAIVSGSGIHVLGGSPNRGGGNQKNMEYLGDDNPIGITSISSQLIGPATVQINDNDTALVDINILNGNIGIYIRSMEITGPDASDFAIENGALSNALLTVDSTHTIGVSLSGTGAGRSAILTINHGTSSEFSINLESAPTQNIAPVAVANASILGGEAPLVVSFDGSQSTDDNSIALYFWDFGDGNNSNQENPDHTFTGPGIYNVSLTVTDDEGLEDSSSLAITVIDPNQEGVTGFTMVDSATNNDIYNIFEGLQIDISEIESLLVNIRANTNPPTVGSVLLELTGPLQNTRGESVAPYALYGDVSGNYFGEQFPIGSYSISGTPFSGSGLSGEQGTTITVNFSIVEELANQPPIAQLVAT
ncbi:PKD domain-containing protein, partial [Muricauda sp. 2012CJ35-5]